MPPQIAAGWPTQPLLAGVFMVCKTPQEAVKFLWGSSGRRTWSDAFFGSGTCWMLFFIAVFYLKWWYRGPDIKQPSLPGQPSLQFNFSNPSADWRLQILQFPPTVADTHVRLSGKWILSVRVTCLECIPVSDPMHAGIDSNTSTAPIGNKHQLTE